MWPHGDYPLIEVGRMTLDRNPTDHHAEIEQAAFQPNNLVPGIGPSPDRMLLARLFSYADAHRHRIGANYQQTPRQRAQSSRCTPTRKDGAMRVPEDRRPGVRARTRRAAPRPTPSRYGSPPSWHADGDIIRTAYVAHAEDDDWGQAGTMVREVLDDAARDRLVDNVVGHLLNGVTEPVLQRAFEYWRNIDDGIGARIEEGVRAKV